MGLLKIVPGNNRRATVRINPIADLSSVGRRTSSIGCIYYRVTVARAAAGLLANQPAVGRPLSAARTKVHRAGGIYSTNRDEAISRLSRRSRRQNDAARRGDDDNRGSRPRGEYRRSLDPTSCCVVGVIANVVILGGGTRAYANRNRTRDTTRSVTPHLSERSEAERSGAGPKPEVERRMPASSGIITEIDRET